jgi:hypothetical protein
MIRLRCRRLCRRVLLRRTEPDLQLRLLLAPMALRGCARAPAYRRLRLLPATPAGLRPLGAQAPRGVVVRGTLSRYALPGALPPLDPAPSCSVVGDFFCPRSSEQTRISAGAVSI